MVVGGLKKNIKQTDQLEYEGQNLQSTKYKWVDIGHKHWKSSPWSLMGNFSYSESQVTIVWHFSVTLLLCEVPKIKRSSMMLHIT